MYLANRRGSTGDRGSTSSVMRFLVRWVCLLAVPLGLSVIFLSAPTLFHSVGYLNDLGRRYALIGGALSLCAAFALAVTPLPAWSRDLLAVCWLIGALVWLFDSSGGEEAVSKWAIEALWLLCGILGLGLAALLLRSRERRVVG
jgi:hypothetical protein